MRNYLPRSTGFANIRVLMAATLAIFLSAALGSARAENDAEKLPPGFSLSRTGDIHDFDYFIGGWTTKQRRLKTVGVGSADWEEFPATECLTPYLAGLATVDELFMPTKGKAGLTLRAFDLHKKQWSIYWVSSSTGTLDPLPVIGGFQGNHGEFYGADEIDNRPVKVRYMWDKIDHDHAGWQQAFSFDNQTWETNWIGEFTRAQTSEVCVNGQPKR